MAGRKHGAFNSKVERQPYFLRKAPVDGKVATEAVMACAKCGGERARANTLHMPPDQVTRKWVKEGWVVGTKGNLCPECATARRPSQAPAAKQYIKKEEAPMAEVIAITGSSRAASAEDKQRMRDKLDGVFDGPKGLYLDSYSDGKIAEELNLPRKMVEEFREIAYGPVKVNPEIARLRVEVAKSETELAALRAEAENLASKVKGAALVVRDLVRRLDAASA